MTKFAVVVVGYITKWIEVEPLTTIIKQKVSNFVWRSIVCQFGVPNTIISDNGKQFNNASFKRFCSNLGIRHLYSLSTHPQANEHVEVVNKIIKRKLKAKIEG